MQKLPLKKLRLSLHLLYSKNIIYFYPTVIIISTKLRTGDTDMKNKKFGNLMIALLCTSLASSLLISGCNDAEKKDTSETSAKTTDSSDSSNEIVELSYNEGTATKITLNGDSASVSGKGAKTDKSTVTINDKGTYIVSGNLKNGQIIIDAGEDDTVNIILNNADIHFSDGPAIYAPKCSETVISLETGTTNSISDDGVYTGSDSDDSEVPNAALYIQDNLTILGGGTLNVTSDRNNGITAKDTLNIKSGTINVTSEHHGISGKDNLNVSGGNITVESRDGDGMRSNYNKTEDETMGNVNIENATISIKAANDGIQAERVLTVKSGDITVTTGNGASDAASSANSDTTDSMKALKAGTAVNIDGGNITVDAYNDSVHSNGDVTVTNGTMTLKSGDDAFHADNNLNISGGNITVEQSHEGLEADNINISGGTVDLTADDDGVNCSGGNDFSGLGGMDGGRGFGRKIPQNFEQTNDTSDTSTGALKISGGTIYVNAQGDGLDSNGNLDISGGTVIINGTTQSGNGILDHDGSCTLTGGTLIGAGTSDMLEMPSANGQNIATVLFEQKQSAGTSVYLTDNSGKVLAAMSPVKEFGCIVFSTADLKTGETYKVYTGGTVTGDNVQGYYTKPEVTSEGTLYSTFTISETLTYADSSGNTTYNGGMGNFGGKGGRGGFGGMNGQQPDTPPDAAGGQQSGTMPDTTDGQQPAPPNGTDGRQPTPPGEIQQSSLQNNNQSI